MTHRCPLCGGATRKPPVTQLRRQLANIGPNWVTIRTGASRWLVYKMRNRYPEIEWEAQRDTLHGGSTGAWTVYARKS